MTTKQEQREDLERAQWILDNEREHLTNGGLLIFAAEYGTGLTDYFRVVTSRNLGGREVLSHLTWAIAKVLGYSLRDRTGGFRLAVSGGNFSKTDEIARAMAHYYGVDRIFYATI